MALVKEITPTAPSAFDAHHPPSTEIIDKCVHCGFCLPACPTYVLWREEMDSPRGRIYQMKMAADGITAIDESFVRHMDRCLGCMACMTACPSGVDYGKLIEATRAQIERNYPRSASERRIRELVFKTFPYPERLKWLLAPVYLYQRSGMRGFARRTGLLRLLPKRLRDMEAMLPTLRSAEQMPNVIPARGKTRMRVGLLLGCVQRVFFPQVNAATARVLAAEGCEVVIPHDQGCCGALMVHSGEEQQALAFARSMIDVFDRANVDAVVINAAGCGSSMKEYGHLLRDDPSYARRARAFSAKCKDVSEILNSLEPRSHFKPLPVRVAYHDACHLQHAQGVRIQPRQLLSRIPEMELLEIPESAICCGSAGTYNILQPQTAQELGDRKADNVKSLAPDVVASSNPGCLLQIRAALERQGERTPVVHLAELLDASIRGLPRDELLRQ